MSRNVHTGAFIVPRLPSSPRWKPVRYRRAIARVDRDAAQSTTGSARSTTCVCRWAAPA